MNAISDASVLALWRKSTYSENGEGACVEVSDGYAAGVPVRDSKAPNGPALVFGTNTWASFVTGVQEGAFSNAD
ncbi:DUF397 domain-containing protein [Streptomyces sp. NPDC088341]|uniref:DUF397 domain-containing protein n=1 Tax=Streptomyces sp. NPDC088341 TaxID=3154870 RepID=UPI003447C947